MHRAFASSTAPGRHDGAIEKLHGALSKQHAASAAQTLFCDASHATDVDVAYHAR